MLSEFSWLASSLALLRLATLVLALRLTLLGLAGPRLRHLVRRMCAARQAPLWEALRPGSALLAQDRLIMSRSISKRSERDQAQQRPHRSSQQSIYFLLLIRIRR